MAFKDRKQRHWMAGGFVVGGLLVGLQLATRDLPTFDGAQTIDGLRFVKDVQAMKKSDRAPVIRNIVAYPEYPPPPGDMPGVVARQPVRGERLQPTRDGRQVYVPFVLYAPVPFIVGGSVPPPSGAMDTVLGVLEQRQHELKVKVYRFAWWATVPAIIAMWGGGGFFLVGRVLPLIIKLVTGAGSKAQVPTEPAYDLDRFGKHPEDDFPATAVVGSHAADLDALRAIEEELEAKLSNGEPVKTEASPNVAFPPAAAPVRPLSATPLEAPQTAAATEHYYEGQYYPVERDVRGSASGIPRRTKADE